MHAISLDIPDVKILKPDVIHDDRGFLFESFRQDRVESLIGLGHGFVQENHSRSHQGVLRGLHYQMPPRAQGKLVRVLSGRIWDVAVDIRKNSPTFGRWVGLELSAEDFIQLWIPPGFAHGFLVLSEYADVSYKMTEYYCALSARGIFWNDQEIGITWPKIERELRTSEADRHHPSLSEAELF